jgi:Tfp pilus assembly protein PilF
MTDLSTSDYVQLITDSLTNGQRKQASKQFREAINDDCSTQALLNEIADVIGERETLSLAAQLITEGDL